MPGSSWVRLAEAGGSDLFGGWRTYRLLAGLGTKLACLKFRANIDGIVFWCFSRFGMKPHALAKPFDLVCKFIYEGCLLYTSPSPRDVEESRMPSSA